MTMSKQALSEAFAWRKRWVVEPDSNAKLFRKAARFTERLLPGICENCYAADEHGKPGVTCNCPTCHGTGQLWDEGLVEVVALAFAPWLTDVEFDDDAARVVLSALAGEVGK